MINHFANQSQTFEILKILFFFFPFFFYIESKLWEVVKSQVELMRINFKFDAPILHVPIITYIIYYSSL